MKVLMWVPLPPPYAGPEVASQQLVEACRAYLDLDVESATLRASNAAKGNLDLAGVAAFTRAYVRFLRAARRADVVYLVAAANRVGCLRDAVLVATARALGKSIVLHLRGGSYAKFYATSNPAMQAVLRRTWGSADRAIAQTPRLRDELAEAAPHVAVSIVPNGLRGADHPAKSTYATHGLRILFVGHLAASKGFPDLVRAFRSVRRAHPDAVLMCAGELIGSEAPVGEPGIEYAGIVGGEAKRALFASADVFALPSYSEGFSLAILEAMFHGLPIVTTRVGGSPEVVGPDQGVLFEPGDVAGLIAAIEQLVDPVVRERMGRRNAAIARERYELDAVARTFAEVFSSTNTARFAASTSGSTGAKRAL